MTPPRLLSGIGVGSVPESVRKGIKSIMLALVLLVGCTACLWNAHGRPADNPDGEIPSPPIHVRILEWKRPNLFVGEFVRRGHWFKDSFILITKQAVGDAIGQGWYAPNWSSSANPPELTPEEEIARLHMLDRWPVGTVIEVDYPLVQTKSKLDQDGQVRMDRSLVTRYGGFLVVIVDFSPKAMGSRK